MSATIINMRMTVAGNEAVFNSKNTGLDLDLTHIQFGSGNKNPTGEEVALVTPQQTAPISGGTKISTDHGVQIRMSAWFEGTTSYDICEIGVWSGLPDDPDSVLFAYWSQENGRVAVMSSGVDFVFTHDMTLDSSVGEMLNIVIDPDASTALVLMASHEADPNPHPQYRLPTGGSTGQVLTKTSDDGGVAWEDINISGVPLGTILPIGVNFPTPQGFVNISYSQPSYHPVAGMAADFVVGYYCGDAKNATADFGYRCNNLDGTGRNINGQYIAIEPAANRGYMGLDDTGEFDHFNVHEDQMQGFSPVASVAYGQSASIDSENAVGKPYRNRGGGVIPAIVGTSAWDAIATANDSHIWGTGYVVDDGVNGQVRMGKQTLPPRIYKKFIMKVADGAVGDPALVDWQAWFDKWTEFSASKLNRSEAFLTNPEWNDVTVSRQRSTWYQNTTSRWLLVNVNSSAVISQSQGLFTSEDSVWGPTPYESKVFSGTGGLPNTNRFTCMIMVPPGWYYIFGRDPSLGASSATVHSWFEA